MKCSKCHNTLEKLHFTRKGKVHKTCNECSEKRKPKTDDKPFKKCPRCHKKYYNIIPVEKPFILDNYHCKTHKKTECYECHRAPKFHPFFRYLEPHKTCNVCFFKKYITDDFKLRYPDIYLHPTVTGAQDWSANKHLDNQYDFWHYLNLKDDTVLNLPHGVYRLEYTPEERNNEDVYDIHMIMRTPENYIELVPLSKIPALYW